MQDVEEDVVVVPDLKEEVAPLEATPGPRVAAPQLGAPLTGPPQLGGPQDFTLRAPAPTPALRPPPSPLPGFWCKAPTAPAPVTNAPALVTDAPALVLMLLFLLSLSLLLLTNCYFFCSYCSASSCSLTPYLLTPS